MADSLPGNFPIEKLQRRNNYASWKFAMQAFLECEELWRCVQGTPPYTENARKMAKAKARIILSVEKQNYSHVRNVSTPKEAWKTLQEAFEDKSLTRKVGLTTAKLVNCKSIKIYVNEIMETAQKLGESRCISASRYKTKWSEHFCYPDCLTNINS